MTETSTSQDTGPMTEAQAAEAFLTMLDGDVQSEGEGALEDENPQTDEGEAEEVEPESEQSEDEEESAEETEEQPDTYRVKIDGEEVEVTLEEALKGYQREQDYTRKTQALAGERKALAEQQAAFAADREKTQTLLKTLEERLSDNDDQEDLDYLRVNDPAEYAARIAEKMQRQTIAQAAAMERQRLELLAEQERYKADQEASIEATGKLLAAIPEWKDPEVAKKDMQKISDYARAIGYADTDLNEIMDHRLFVMAKDAAAFRALKANRPQPVQKVSKVAVSKPGASQVQTKAKVTDTTRGIQRLAKTGREQDAAAVFLTMLS